MNIYDSASTALLTDLYELTMMQGYYLYGRNTDVVFDMFFRKPPFGGGYAVFAGLEPLVRALTKFRFDDEQLSYLSGLGLFKDEFLRFLSTLRFRGDLYAVEEGELVFPGEPLLRVHARMIEAQMIESILLNIINFQTLIATKTARIVEASGDRAVSEFGLRRAQGIDGALSAARAAFVGGAASTSNLLAGKIFGLPVQGTMAHSWVMTFSSEQDAFARYARLYPGHTILLVDTYDTLRQGIPAAIMVFKKLKAAGRKNFGLRLDSGDLEYLSKRARGLLDAAGLKEAKIVASNELDEYIIEELVNKGSPIDIFGVGTKLVTAYDDPALTGIYKLVARKAGKTFVPVIKLSNNPEKTTSPHIKNVMRLYDKEGSMLGDQVFLESERRSLERRAARRLPMVFYHPEYSYESLAMADYADGKVLLRPIMKNGEPVYEFPGLPVLQKRTRSNLQRLHPSFRRLLNPHVYKVSLTKKLIDTKIRMIKKYS
jgi:nicotinate phosphoribosyltransferase